QGGFRMMLVRPVALSDHKELLALAQEAGIGMTSLPPDAGVLERKIAKSVASCASVVDAEDESFLFVMQDTETGQLVGTAGVVAHVGIKHPFYSYKLSTIVQACDELGVYSNHYVLHMVNDYTHASEIGSLFLLPAYRRDGIGSFLSRCRYLMLAEFPELFSEVVISEIRGVQDEFGESPFYKNLAQHFFKMEFKRADFIHATKGGQFISDLMPRYPIYVNLLDEKAQEVIGVPLAASLPAMSLLEKEGFRYQGYIDVFDAGPTMQAERSTLRTVRKSKRVELAGTGDTPAGVRCMVATTRRDDFRVVFTDAEVQKGGLVISAEAAGHLQVRTGDNLRYMPL
ncbi:MAG: arginine N-succinyltransferase, partial [Rickettsiales bacterium]|nr:arginine N-succinyltransferase [Rickettsiales bacterium]